MSGAVTQIARERDQALARIQALAAEIRAHEQTLRRSIASPRRPAGQARVPDGADSIRRGRGPWA
jgi:hypothetical protein